MNKKEKTKFPSNSSIGIDLPTGVQHYVALNDQKSGDFILPGVDFNLLSKMQDEHPVHKLAIDTKVNLYMLAVNIVDKKILGRAELKKALRDFVLFGNGYLEKVVVGNRHCFRHLNARLVRVKANQDWVMITSGLNNENKKIGFMLHLMDYDDRTFFYGLPNYLSALRAITLAKNAVNRRLALHQNGMDSGILAVNIDSGETQDEHDNMVNDPKYDEFINNLKDSKKTKAGRIIFFNFNRPDEEVDIKKRIHFTPLGIPLNEDGFEDTQAESRKQIIEAHGINADLLGVTGDKGKAMSSNQARLLNTCLQTNIYPMLEILKEQMLDEDGKELIEIKQFELDRHGTIKKK